MCNKGVNTHPSTKQIVPESYESQEIWNKAVHRFFFASDSIPD